MKRRSVIAAAGLDLTAQTNPPGSGSLYIPKPNRVQDRKLLHDFMDEFSFVDLVTTDPSLHISHIPVALARDAATNGVLFGHISRQNPQTEAVLAGQRAVAVFHGPHSYISPTWYSKAEVVPTWNYASVHATGNLKPVTDENAARDVLAMLVAKFEGPASRYDFAKLPPGYISGLIAGILAFELAIELLEGKFKLGQDRSEADKQGILNHLRTAPAERSLHDLTAAFYERQKDQ